MKSIAIACTPYLARTSAVLAAVIALSVLLYGVFLLEAVANTAKRTAAERTVREIASRVSALEGQYLTHTQALTLARATDLGFVVPADSTTVFASEGARTLTASAVGSR
ncbi:MAG TPA: hypothetical protein VHD55_03395 [Candidatus Paceibacterota bacterium]|nr:hypothetical protein [Candidatus Paceibacterota bacterium]